MIGRVAPSHKTARYAECSAKLKLATGLVLYSVRLEAQPQPSLRSGRANQAAQKVLRHGADHFVPWVSPTEPITQSECASILRFSLCVTA